MSESASVFGALGAAIVDRGAWQVVKATGGDRLTFLHRLLTTSVEDLQPGQGKHALLLNIKGHVMAELRLCVRADEVWLLVPPGQGEAAAAALSRYAIMDDVALTLDPTLGLLAVYGPRAADHLGAAGIAIPAAVVAGASLAHATVDLGGAALEVIQSRGLGNQGFWLIGDAAVLADVGARIRATGIAELPPETAEGLRIRAGEPKFGAEITPEVFPMEAGLDDLIDYGKGCYLGQEPIVRIRDRGQINRRLVGLRLAGDGLLAAGDAIETDERPKAGRVTSASRLPEGPVALALVHKGVPVGATVRVRNGERAVEAEVVPAVPTGAA